MENITPGRYTNPWLESVRYAWRLLWGKTLPEDHVHLSSDQTRAGLVRVEDAASKPFAFVFPLSFDAFPRSMRPSSFSPRAKVMCRLVRNPRLALEASRAFGKTVRQLMPGYMVIFKNMTMRAKVEKARARVRARKIPSVAEVMKQEREKQARQQRRRAKASNVGDMECSL
ncbi:hypothetical protein PsYK624_167900 [Phanerochaete sordida]|uniref:Uncharacterized protein n=1 Tax=Phanerochaete sordida TaxID=48140 RepID=A0A9P3GXK1_9APHY|nr:hypothetical protein PsYK624_167900 [Phanerochaete sordida]